MDGVRPCYCAVLDRTGHRAFICYSRARSGVFLIGLTDAADVWSSEFSGEALQELRQRFLLGSSEDDFIVRLRSSCGGGDVSVAVGDSAAELRVGSGPGAPSVALGRLEAPRAAAELKELLFSMASSLTQLQGAVPAASPVRSQQRRPPGEVIRKPSDFEPRQQNGGAAAKRRLAGASLINPGAKRKLQATGVAFDDAEEDD